MPPARRHHYLPKFYLAGFTHSGDVEDALWVLDAKEGRQWQSRPAGVAFERDLYRVDAPGVAPDAVEHAFSQFEGQAATVLRGVIQSKRMPEGDYFGVLLNLVAFMAVRIPALRNRFAEGLSKALKMAMQVRVETPERWTALLQRLREEGKEIAESPYEDMKAFIEKDAYSIEFPSNWFLPYLFESIKTILPFLAQRNWTLAIAQEGSFICSDRPVALAWTVPPSAFWPPGHGLANTELTMPLSRELALLARFEGMPERLEANRQSVATINSRTGMYAERLILSPEQELIWLKQGNTIGTTAELIAAIQQERPAPPDADPTI